MSNRPLPNDSHMYQPKNLNSNINLPFPNNPTPLNSTLLSKMDEDCLFFMFFIQQVKNNQFKIIQDQSAVEAAKELKNRGWYYHKKYLTWFKPHGQPRLKADDRIEGKFQYFDFEEGKINIKISKIGKLQSEKILNWS